MELKCFGKTCFLCASSQTISFAQRLLLNIENTLFSTTVSSQGMTTISSEAMSVCVCVFVHGNYAYDL